MATWNPNNYGTLMGWNQLVKVNQTPIKVSEFNIGITQDFEVPDLVAGRVDRLTWSKGVIRVGGNIRAPFTKSFGNSIVKAAFDAAKGDGLGMMNISSSVHGEMVGCYVNTLSIRAEAEKAIEVSAELFGRLGQYVNSSSDGGEAVGVTDAGSLSTMGNSPSGIVTEQIPMFDRIRIGSSFYPGGVSKLLMTNFTFELNNNLTRNYVFDYSGNYSSLDAFSISVGQRTMKGTATFQSGAANPSLIGIVNSVGVTEPSGYLLNIHDGSTLLLNIPATSFYVLWSAAPPTLNTGKVQVEMQYQLIAKGTGTINSITVD